MAYIPKPGSFTLFNNDYKTKDNQPDFKGNGLDLEGKEIQISAWKKQGPKGEFISVSFEIKKEKAPYSTEEKPAAKPAAKHAGISTPNKFEDSDIPF